MHRIALAGAAAASFLAIVPATSPAVANVNGCDDVTPTIVGTDGPDRIVGTPSADVIFAGDGDDVVLGYGGDDYICLGDGDDLGRGGAGIDEIDGASGDDTLKGESGTDWLRGHEGDDRIETGPSGFTELASLADGGPGNDLILGGAWPDHVDGGEGDDLIRGAAGPDLIYGKDGNDEIHGGYGNDTIVGYEGVDRIYGDQDNDWLTAPTSSSNRRPARRVRSSWAAAGSTGATAVRRLPCSPASRRPAPDPAQSGMTASASRAPRSVPDQSVLVGSPSSWSWVLPAVR